MYRKRHPGVAAACLLAVGVLAATTSHHATPPIAPANVAASHPCTPSDFYMQCALPAPTVGITPRATTTGAFGVDFGWSGITAARARALGARFGASYFSADRSKNWTAAAVGAYHAAGLATVGVWETTASRATAGPIAGAEDARAARQQAAAVGNTTRPIDFAIDCDCAPASIIGYFRGVHSVLGARTSAYGGYSQIWALSHAGLVGHENWQTYAWSNGGWLSKSIAPLEQYLNGSAFDNDRALAPAYGQWPYSKPKPKPAPLPVCIHHRESKATCAAAKAKVAADGRAVTASRRALVTVNRDLRAHACRKPYRRRVCRTDGRAAATFTQRIRFFGAAGARVKAAN